LFITLRKYSAKGQAHCPRGFAQQNQSDVFL
jgi:hypothetical protein